MENKYEEYSPHFIHTILQQYKREVMGLQLLQRKMVSKAEDNWSLTDIPSGTEPNPRSSNKAVEIHAVS
jgi:hypothetical protein